MGSSGSTVAGRGPCGCCEGPLRRLTGGGRPVRGYFDGCFDLMHAGHYNALRQAKQLCDVLVVGIHSDEEIALSKAPPVMLENERYEMLKHIKWVDEILYDVPYSPSMETLDLAKADFCVHGDDMPVGPDGRGAYDDMRDAGRLRIIKRTEGVSTTDLVGRLLLLTKEHLDLKTDYGEGTSSNPTRPRSASRGRGRSSSPGNPPRSPAAAPPTSNRQFLATSRRIAEFSSRRVPTPEDVVVYIDGAFDMFHIAHALVLEKAKQVGTFLIVGIHDDVTVNWTLGANYPVMNLHERALTVCACKHVDEIIIGAPREITQDLITSMGISIVVEVKSKREGLSRGRDRFAVAKQSGIYRQVDDVMPHLSHEVIVGRILGNRKTYLDRNASRAPREDAYYDQKAQAQSQIKEQ